MVSLLCAYLFLFYDTIIHRKYFNRCIQQIKLILNVLFVFCNTLLRLLKCKHAILHYIALKCILDTEIVFCICRTLYLRKQKMYTMLCIRKHITHTYIQRCIYVNIEHC